jgi:hypothetical protein
MSASLWGARRGDERTIAGLRNGSNQKLHYIHTHTFTVKQPYKTQKPTKTKTKTKTNDDDFINKNKTIRIEFIYMCVEGVKS